MSTYLNKKEGLDTINKLGKEKNPFFFFISYDGKKCFVSPLNAINPEDVLYDISGLSNTTFPQSVPHNLVWHPEPMSYESYKVGFDYVHHQLLAGNSYLINYTARTPLHTSINLKEIFYATKARYKLYFKNSFVCFSPETFIKIENGIISSYPMKGTTNGNDDNQLNKLLDNAKEQAEHATIVDLIRNDLSIVADNVKIKKYRYAEKVKSMKGDLWQTSSEIEGSLLPYYANNLGSTLFSLLPAGSITGAPKKKTTEIIAKAENFDRGFYTGICGIFDGKKLDSGVMIRFVEETNDQQFFLSGGGITAQSDAKSEYNEMIIKTNVPIY